MKKKITLAACLLASAAQAYSGAEMLNDLRMGGLGYVKAGHFVQGVMGGSTITHYVTETPKFVCVPDATTASRVIEIVRRRLEDEPTKDLQQSAAGFVLLAARNEWPCRPAAKGAKGKPM